MSERGKKRDVGEKPINGNKKKAAIYSILLIAGILTGMMLQSILPVFPQQNVITGGNISTEFRISQGFYLTRKNGSSYIEYQNSSYLLGAVGFEYLEADQRTFREFRAFIDAGNMINISDFDYEDLNEILSSYDISVGTGFKGWSDLNDSIFMTGDKIVEGLDGKSKTYVSSEVMLLGYFSFAIHYSNKEYYMDPDVATLDLPDALFSQILDPMMINKNTVIVFNGVVVDYDGTGVVQDTFMDVTINGVQKVIGVNP